VSKLSPEQLIDSHIKTVSLPSIVSQVNQLANEPTASAADIAQAIGQDSALTVRLLKIVNSPFFNFPSRIDSLSMAVTVLGTRQLRDLVIAAGLIKRFQININPEFDPETFWCHSITTGIAARNIALRLMLGNSERFFVTGLVHDMGKLIMALIEPVEFGTLMLELGKQDCDISNIEQKIFGYTHDELAVVLLKDWQFPESIYIPVGAHVTLQHAGSYEKDTALLHLANYIANNMQTPISRDDDIVLNPRAIEILDMTPEMIETVYEETYRHLDELLDIFYYQVVA
jgi:HD-like signal output (HDOD) protein